VERSLSSIRLHFKPLKIKMFEPYKGADDIQISGALVMPKGIFLAETGSA